MLGCKKPSDELFREPPGCIQLGRRLSNRNDPTPRAIFSRITTRAPCMSAQRKQIAPAETLLPSHPQASFAGARIACFLAPAIHKKRMKPSHHSCLVSHLYTSKYTYISLFSENNSVFCFKEKNREATRERGEGSEPRWTPPS
jgi:hypothetical protein